MIDRCIHCNRLSHHATETNGVCIGCFYGDLIFDEDDGDIIYEDEE